MSTAFKRPWIARGVALGASVAMIGGLSLVTATAAQADDGTVTVYPGDIVYTGESTPPEHYTQWHQGYDSPASDAAAITADGLQLKGESQIIKGLATRLTIDQLEDAIVDGQISWTSTDSSDPAFFQIPVFFGSTSSPSFATLRPATPSAGQNYVEFGQDWQASADIGSYVADSTTTLDDLFDALRDAGDVQVLGFGVLSEIGTTSVVTGISWGGTDYSFSLDPVTAGTVTISGSPVVGSVLTATPAGWPSGATLSYAWSYNGGQFGGLVDGATSSTLTITKDLVGMKITAWVTGSKTGFSDTEVRSSETATVTAPKKAAAPAPATNSDALGTFLKNNNVTPVTQTSTGLPSGELNPAKPYTSNVTWSGADSYVDVYAYSTPVYIGTFPVVGGVAQISLTPAMLAKLPAGSHTLVVTGQTSGSVQAVSVKVAASLASTGVDADVALPLGAAGMFLLAGLGLMLLRRKRTAVSAE